MQFDDVSQKVSPLFLSLDSSFEFGDLNCVVCGKCESRSCSDERGDVPLASLTFWNVWKAGKQVVKKFENLVDA